MAIDKNDPKLTAFVLGELAEDEAQTIGTAIDADPELQLEVDAIRKIVAEIESAMQAEPLPDGANVSTLSAIDTPKTEPKKKRRFQFTLAELLVVVAVGGVLIALLMPARQAARNASTRMMERNKAMQAEMDAEAAAPAAEAMPLSAENEPIDTLRYQPDAVMSRPLILPNAATDFDSNVARPRVADERSLPEQGNIYRLKLESGADGGAASEHAGTMEYNQAIPSTSAVPARGTPKDPSFYGGSVVGGVAIDGKGNLLAADPGSARGKKRGDQSIQMMVTPRMIEQDVEEESSAAAPARKDDAPKYMSVKVYPTADLVADPYNASNAESYKNFVENEFLRPRDAPFSTFSIDVDTAAYTTMRRFVLDMNRRPPPDSVRLEEYVNYFQYDYAPPADAKPFATHVDVAKCPWEPTHLLARIGIKGKEYGVDERPPLNLVFLIDTSGSMSSSNRLPLVGRGLTELVEMLQPKDRVAIVTYAGSSRVALPSVSGQEKQAILDSINSLAAGGSTAGAEGIKTAYEVARKYYDKNAQNRVILCTDGDFNVGMTDNDRLEKLIGDEAKSGVFLTVLGFGMGNYKDDRLKTLSMRGNGNYGYIDSIDEARRLLVEGLTGTLFAIAKDVKIQVDFNPRRVAAYRLLGYENRKLRDEDFHDDKVDAGEIGAGHTVTALYEIIPTGVAVPSKVDESRYADQEAGVSTPAPFEANFSTEPPHERELMFVKLRYKEPDGDRSSLLEYPVVLDGESKLDLSPDAQFAAAVALYGMLLRQSRYAGSGTFDAVLELAAPNTKDDKYRKEFIEIVKEAMQWRP